MRKWLRIFVPVMMLCLVMTAAVPQHASANEGKDNSKAAIGLETKDKKVSIGQEVKVRVVVKQVTDLYGIQFQVKYDPSKITFKEAKTLGKYNDFGGQKVDESNGTVLLPLLREQLINKGKVSSLEIAELSFIAKASGETSLLIEELRAISSETFTNAKGYTDLKSIAMTIDKAMKVTINAPAPRELLEEAEQLLKDNKLMETKDALVSALAKGAPKLTSKERDQWKSIAQRLVTQLQSQVAYSYDAAVSALKMDDQSLQYAIASITELLKLGKNNNIRLSVDKEIHIELTADDHHSVTLSPRQTYLLKKNDFELVLEWPQGTMILSEDTLLKDRNMLISFKASAPSTLSNSNNKQRIVAQYEIGVATLVQGKYVNVSKLADEVELELRYSADQGRAKKLGVYVWNESSSSWTRLSGTKHKNGMFELEIEKPGKYSVIEN